MNKNRNNLSFQTEYSVAFQWKNKERPDKLKHPKSFFQDYSAHNSRHKLKQFILEKLEKMEADYNHQGRHSRSRLSSNNSYKPARCSSKTSSKVRNGDMRKSDPQSDLIRSRSMALEFKRKNESTQIWWWNEDVSDEQSEEDYRLSPALNRSFNAQEFVVIPERKTAVRRHSFISPKPSSTNPSQSTYTRSSVSAQMAQATGYQSTTDDISSFHHDNEQRSNEEKDLQLQVGPDNKGPGVPRLSLRVSDDDDLLSSEASNHIIFNSPYQKEDFIKDSTSSESNSPLPLISGTYRLQ